MAYGITRAGKKPGLFGSMKDYSTPPIAPEPMQHSAGQRQMAQPATQPEGKKRSILPYALAAIEDTLSRQMGYAPQGVARINAQQAEQQKARDAQAAAELQRAQELADWKWRKDYEWQNAPEPNNDTIADFEWYKNLSPEDRETYHRMKPQYMTVDNGDGTKSIIPIGANGPIMGGGQQGPLPTFTAEDWEAAGSNSGGSF